MLLYASRSVQLGLRMASLTFTRAVHNIHEKANIVQADMCLVFGTPLQMSCCVQRHQSVLTRRLMSCEMLVLRLMSGEMLV